MTHETIKLKRAEKECKVVAKCDHPPPIPGSHRGQRNAE